MEISDRLLVTGVMQRRFALPLLAILALSAAAQTPAPAPSKPVAIINGEVITAAKLDQLYDRLGTGMREQYEKSGGKAAFLENYLRKRLIVQEAMKSGFDKRPDVQADMEASRESTLFDRYVRDVVSAPIVTEAMLRQYYDQHPDEFATPERLKVRHIVVTATNVGSRAKSKEQALETIKKVATTLREEDAATQRAADPEIIKRLRLAHFAQLAKRYSEDASAEAGGDLGWVTRGQLDPEFEAAAFGLPVGVPSGIVETKFGYHIILVEAKQLAGIESYDEAKPKLREFMMNQNASQVMEALTRLTNELRGSSKIAVYPENIK